MSSSRQLMRWSPQVHQDILIATFCNLSLSSEQWAKVMADLSEMGYTFSESALRGRIIARSFSALRSLQSDLLHCCSIPYICTTLSHPCRPLLSLSLAHTRYPSPSFSSIYSCHLKLPTMGASKKDATPSGNKPARGWDATAHEALLLCVIDEIKGGKAFLTEVTRRMQERGYTYSYDAINQHVQKLRKARDTNGIVNAADPSASKAAATPRKAAATPHKRRTPAKKEIDEDDEDDDIKLKLEQAADDDDEMPSPSIRPLKRARTSLPSFDDGLGEGEI
ncbi:hypothetical protein ACQKWADRAFT_290889 [Trichoderma austrokoningii]